MTFTFTCATTSAVECPDPVTLSDDGAGQTRTVTVTAADGGSTTVTTDEVNIDQTAPTVTLEGLVEGENYETAPAVEDLDCVATDGTSGIDSCEITVEVLDEDAPDTDVSTGDGDVVVLGRSLTAPAASAVPAAADADVQRIAYTATATDNAGNSAVQTTTITVSAESSGPGEPEPGGPGDPDDSGEPGEPGGTDSPSKSGGEDSNRTTTQKTSAMPSEGLPNAGGPNVVVALLGLITLLAGGVLALAARQRRTDS